jgi:hypothetical protein
MKDDAYIYWSVNDYEIMQIVLTDKYQAVFAQADNENDPNGPHHLEAMDIEGLAVARVIVTDYRRLKTASEYAAGEIERKSSHRDIVGISLYASGDWQVCNQASNFGGLIKRGDSPKTADYYLSSRYIQLIPDDEEEQRDGEKDWGNHLKIEEPEPHFGDSSDLD